MKNTGKMKFLPLMLAVLMVAALALAGCGSDNNAETTAPAGTTAAVETTAATEAVETTAATDAVETTAATEATTAADVTVMGEGAVGFNFVSTDLEGKETHYEIHTDKKTVGEALMDNKLVDGTVGEWGLMVETVNGLTLSYDKDQMYWAFYIDGEYAQTGVDSTDITAGATYSMVPTKAE